MILIGLGYRARAGKDTVGSYLVNKYGFHKASFAYNLKKAAEVIFGLSLRQLDNDLKEVMDERWGMTPREILQKMGTEAIRGTFGPDIWVDSLFNRLPDMDWVITDVRFPSEAEAIKKRGGKLIRIERPGAGASGGVEKHASEVAMDSYDGWDATVWGEDGEFEDLYRKVDDAMLELTKDGWGGKLATETRLKTLARTVLEDLG